MISAALIGIVVAVVGVGLHWQRVSTQAAPPIRGDVLLVFAHPDDEVMFFTPLLDLLQSREIAVHFLCLSNGNFEGHGKAREAELVESAAYFGVPKKNVKIVSHPQLQDGMKEDWPAQVVRKEVDAYLQRAGTISTVVTFDGAGVSHHPNHIAVHNGVCAVKNNMPPGLIFLQLHSRSLLTKYLGPLSLLQYWNLSRDTLSRTKFVVITPPSRVGRSYHGMRKHASQLVWFRYLFVAFSSYTFMDELREL